MWDKNTNGTWERRDNYAELDTIIADLSKLKTYSKSLQSSGYMVTNTLADIYGELQFQHAFWVMTTKRVTTDTLRVEDLDIQKGKLVNILRHWSEERTNNSAALREALKNGLLKAANAQLFKRDGALAWFEKYTPNQDAYTGYEDLLITRLYTPESWRGEYQTSDTQLGYTLQHVFTSAKVTEKLLRNFHLVELASREHIDVRSADGTLIEYPILGFDGTAMQEGYRVLLMGQNNPNLNGIYTYQNKTLLYGNPLDDAKDATFFSAYVKDGQTLKGKEFFLSRTENGSYPTQGMPLLFEEGNNYVLRNQISYRLQADHVFSDVQYFKQSLPRLDTSFGDTQTVNGVVYFVSEDAKHLMMRTQVAEQVLSTDVSDAQFLPTVHRVNSKLYAVYYDRTTYNYYLYVYNTLLSQPPTRQQFPLLGKVLNGSLSVVGGSEVFTYVTQYDQHYHIYTGTDQSPVYTTPTLLTDAVTFETPMGKVYFALENTDVVCLYGNKKSRIRSAVNPSKLRVYTTASEVDMVTLSWLENGAPTRYSININNLLGMFGWTKNEDYSFRSFSKTKIGDWEVKNRQLFLKGVQVTNVADAALPAIPKIDNATNRNYDGINGYSQLDNDVVNRLKEASGFTIQFTITPKQIKQNAVVLYFGEKSETSTVETSTGAFDYQASPKNYISFFVADDTLYPFMQLCEGNKTFDIKATQRLAVDQEVEVTFTWDYTSNKGTGRLYFNGELVGEASDTKNTSNVTTFNLPLNVNNIPFERCYLAKSESDKNPLFKGTLSEVRLWNRVFNLSQILARLGQGIDSRDLLYSNLLAYWKLTDVNAVHVDQVNEATGTFMGGLYRDANRAKISVVDQIQLGADYLYLLDSANSTIYRVDLATEQVEVHRATALTTTIKSLYLSGQTLYHLEGESFYQGNTLYYTNRHLSVLDFAVSGSSFLVMYKNDYRLYDSDDAVLFTDTVTSNFETLYLDETSSYIKVYLKEASETTHLLISRGAELEYITKYPFYKNETVTIDLNTFAITAGVVTQNGTELDAQHQWWTPTTAQVFSLQARKQFLLIGTLNRAGEVVIWQYDTVYGGGIALMEGTQRTSLFACPNGVADMCYYENQQVEYLLVLDSANRSIHWYTLEMENKLAWKALRHTYQWSSDVNASYDADLVPQKLVVDNTKISLLSSKGDELYLSTITNATSYYETWKNTQTYRYASNGIVVGEAGLVFTDGSDWAVSKSNMLYKEDFNAVDSLITNVDAGGYLQPTWAGKSWIVGGKGRVFRTQDNAQTWQLLTSGVAQDLNDVSFHDERNGIVVGNHNTLLYTLSGGDTFLPITLPDAVGIHDWVSVLYYRADRALVAGSGGNVLHLSKKSDTWKVDTYTDEQQNIGYSLRSVYREQFTSDTYFRIIRNIHQVSENTFLLSGDGDYLALLTLTFNSIDISYSYAFLKTGLTANWLQALTYTDIVENKQKLFVLSDQQLYNVTLPSLLSTGTVNVNHVDSQLYYTHDTAISRMQLSDNYIIGVGRGASIFKKLIYEDNNGKYIAKPDSLIVAQDVSRFFRAGLIYLDYSVARKVNIHKADGSYEAPVGSFPKSILNCFKFQETEYIEFKDYGATNEQNNFLAYQDFYYLNRRALGTAGTHGVMAAWRRYNKRLTASYHATYNSIAVAAASYHATAATSDSFFVRTEPLTGANLNGEVADESSLTSRLYLRNNALVAAQNDVLKLSFLDPTRTTLAVGDRVMLTIKHNANLPVAYTYATAVVTADDVLSFPHFTLSGLVKAGTSLAAAASSLRTNALNHYKNLLQLRCTPAPLDFDVTVELAVVKAEVLTTVRHEGSTGAVRILVLDELFSADMVQELNAGKLLVRNLNYFNGDLDHLQTVLAEHLLGQSYELLINDANEVTVQAKVTGDNLYYNLENLLEINSIGAVRHFPVAYRSSSVYAPSYSLLNILTPLHPVFTPEYAFNLPSIPVKFNSATRSSGGVHQEFTVSANKILVGQDVAGIEHFKEGFFIDLIRGAATVKRIHIDKVEKVYYDRYPGKFRYELTTNTDIATQLTDAATNGTLRVRNTLAEISNDLEFTDNQMFPLPNTHEFNVTRLTRSYFNQVKTASAYAACLLNDDNIRRHACGVVYIDAEGDWNVNLINWRDDANLTYKPVDLFEYGVDNTFKKSISLDLTNYEVSGKSMALKNVELSSYNYTLINGLSLKDLEARYHWILNADIRNATIGEDDKGLVWYTGSWLSGSWEGGTWHSGTVYNIEWLGGDFYSHAIKNEFNIISVDETVSDPQQSVWYNGTWKSGNFYNGTWYNGRFESGTHHAGAWLDGTFAGGFWKAGVFQGGEWLSGTWLSGTFNQDNSLSTWHDGQWLGGDFENGRWKNGTWDETDRVPSRFGTKATYLKNAVWEYGVWKNGQFYSGSSVDAQGNTVPSGIHNTAFWYNGQWSKGDFYGGTWHHGVWSNGIFHDGVLNSNLNIKSLNVLSANAMEITFADKHYYKTLEGTTNYLLVIGEPVYTKGLVSERCKFLGYNMVPVKHEIKQIVDEYTVLITSVPSFYDDSLVETPSGQRLMDRCALGNCVDYTAVVVDELNKQVLSPLAIDYKKTPSVVTHWVNGTWLAGIWQLGYFNNGSFKTGIWLGGVFESGSFGA